MKRNTRISLLNRDGVRRKVNIEVGETGNHASGDLLDANATENLVNDRISNLINLAPEALDTLGEVADVLGSKVDSSSLSSVAFSGSYNDLENKPNIPTNISTFSNDAGYVTPPEVIGVQAFPSSWPKTGTLPGLILAINNDSNAVAGKAYLATVTYSDLPAGLSQAEIKAEITSVGGAGKVILFTVTSEDVAPYHWERTSAYGRSGEWRSWSVATSDGTQNAASFNIENWSITYATREAPASEIIDVNDVSRDPYKIAVINIDQSNPENISITGDIGKDGDAGSVLQELRNQSRIGALVYDSNLKIAKLYTNWAVAPLENEGLFMHLPKFYFRRIQTVLMNGVCQIQFTMDSSLTDDTWNIWNGNTFIGSYKATGTINNLRSNIAQYAVTNKSQSEFKTSARTLGNGFSIITYEAHQIMALLFYCFYGTADCQNAIGCGFDYRGDYAPYPIGGCDGHLETDSGFDGVLFWGLRDWWGALYEWVDNLVTLDGGYVGIQNYDGSIRRVVKTGDGGGMIQNMLFGQYVDVLPDFSGDQGCGCGCGCGGGGWSDYADVSGGAGCVALRSDAGSGAIAGVGCLIVGYSPSAASSVYGSRLQYTGPYITIQN